MNLIIRVSENKTNGTQFENVLLKCELIFSVLVHKKIYLSVYTRYFEKY